MKADVYAGDLDTPGEEVRADYVLVVDADADPDVLLRVANQLAFANTAPFRVHLVRHGAERVQMEVELRGVSPGVVESIRRKIEKLTCTWSVDVTEINAKETESI